MHLSWSWWQWSEWLKLSKRWLMSKADRRVRTMSYWNYLCIRITFLKASMKNKFVSNELSVLYYFPIKREYLYLEVFFWGSTALYCVHVHHQCLPEKSRVQEFSWYSLPQGTVSLWGQYLPLCLAVEIVLWCLKCVI